MTSHQKTFARATLEYDPDHEKALLEAITTALVTESRVSDCNAVVFRTGEAAQALTTVLAGVLVMSPSATHSPTAIRRTIDSFGKSLRTGFFRIPSASRQLHGERFEVNRHGIGPVLVLEFEDQFPQDLFEKPIARTCERDRVHEMGCVAQDQIAIHEPARAPAFVALEPFSGEDAKQLQFALADKGNVPPGEFDRLGFD
jgi:hypothetical protein